MVSDAEINLRPGRGYTHDDFLYVNCSQACHRERFQDMIQLEEKYLPVGDGGYSYNGQDDPSLGEWRRRVAEWAFNVTDYYLMNRETACVALSFLDRFLASSLPDKTTFQLASMCSLFTAAKLLQRRPIKMSDMVLLSGGRFRQEDIECTERIMLGRLEWRVHPPTPAAFARMMLFYLDAPFAAMTELIERTRYFAELAACDYFFVKHYPSKIATASIFYALEETKDIDIAEEDKRIWVLRMKEELDIHVNDDEVIICTQRLKHIHRAAVDWKNCCQGKQTDSQHFAKPSARVSCELKRRTPSPTSVGGVDGLSIKSFQSSEDGKSSTCKLIDESITST